MNSIAESMYIEFEFEQILSRKKKPEKSKDIHSFYNSLAEDVINTISEALTTVQATTDIKTIADHHITPFVDEWRKQGHSIATGLFGMIDKITFKDERKSKRSIEISSDTTYSIPIHYEDFPVHTIRMKYHPLSKKHLSKKARQGHPLGHGFDFDELFYSEMPRSNSFDFSNQSGVVGIDKSEAIHGFSQNLEVSVGSNDVPMSYKLRSHGRDYLKPYEQAYGLLSEMILFQAYKEKLSKMYPDSEWVFNSSQIFDNDLG